MTAEKTYSLNSILEKIYNTQKNIPIEKDDLKYKEFKHEKIRDLKKLCITLGINLDDFKKNNNYSLPEFVKDIVEEYLSYKGSKGGFISKLRLGNIEEISIEEKMEFTQNLKNRVEKNLEYDKDIQKVIIKLLDSNIYELRFLQVMKVNQELILMHAIETIEKDLTKFTNKNIRDGFIRFRKGWNKLEEDKEQLKQAAFTMGNLGHSLKQTSDEKDVHRIFFSGSDIDELIKIYEELINQASEKWNQIVNNFEDFKMENINGVMNGEINSQYILDQVLMEMEGFEKRSIEREISKNSEEIEKFLNRGNN
jgi:hypothetical protein